MSLGPANDRNTPVETPQNDWTRMIDAVRQRNQSGVSLTPEEIAAGSPITGTSMPSVRSAELGRPAAVDDRTRELTVEEIEELNRAALASGLVRGPVNESMRRTLEGRGVEMGDDVPYASLEDAIRAGAPVGADPEEVDQRAAQFRDTPAPVRPPIGARRQTAREFIAATENVALPRLPDFKKVQMIDTVNGKVYVDGLEFTLEASEVKMLRRFCVEKAKEQIKKALDAALAELAEGTNDGGDGSAV